MEKAYQLLKELDSLYCHRFKGCEQANFIEILLELKDCFVDLNDRNITLQKGIVKRDKKIDDMEKDHMKTFVNNLLDDFEEEIIDKIRDLVEEYKE